LAEAGPGSPEDGLDLLVAIAVFLLQRLHLPRQIPMAGRHLLTGTGRWLFSTDESIAAPRSVKARGR
jgi:hypothetical protein